MKFYIYTSIILTLLAFTLIGCTGAREQTATSPNKPEIESKDGAPSPETAQKTVPGENGKAITVYKSPTCGCCSKWEEHLSKAGFKVTSKPMDNMPEVRKQNGVPDKMQSCHTAVIDGYVIEGHVPAADVEKLLKTRPADVAGLAAPGMPPKSPGMQPEGEKPSGYDVMSFDRQGNAKVFASYK